MTFVTCKALSHCGLKKSVGQVGCLSVCGGLPSFRLNSLSIGVYWFVKKWFFKSAWSRLSSLLPPDWNYRYLFCAGHRTQVDKQLFHFPLHINAKLGTDNREQRWIKNSSPLVPRASQNDCQFSFSSLSNFRGQNDQQRLRGQKHKVSECFRSSSKFLLLAPTPHNTIYFVTLADE